MRMRLIISDIQIVSCVSIAILIHPQRHCSTDLCLNRPNGHHKVPHKRQQAKPPYVLSQNMSKGYSRQKKLFFEYQNWYAGAVNSHLSLHQQAYLSLLVHQNKVHLWSFRRYPQGKL